jgi:hypothetical protein
LIEYITKRKAAALNKVFSSKISIANERRFSYSIIPKNGKENRSVIREIRKVKLRTSNENNTFFSKIAETAEKTAEIKASQNQSISIL